MYTNVAYPNNFMDDFAEKIKPLVVGSCGTYRLLTQKQFSTNRPKGRVDFQLLYIASGKAHFFFDEKEHIVTAGHMIFYAPKEAQNYTYYGKEKPEVYWIHFTGKDVYKILEEYEIPVSEYIFYSGTSMDYQQLFKQIIAELQMCRLGYEELCTMYLRQIFLLIQRKRLEKQDSLNSSMQEEIELARHYFNEHYHEALCIEDYAQSRHMSTCWFIRSFRQLTGYTPMQYILSIRITNAQNLLEMTDYNVTEIANIVGYDNPLYFSRLFKKQTGYSPSAYRKKC